jgi:hypothetical protein
VPFAEHLLVVLDLDAEEPTVFDEDGNWLPHTLVFSVLVKVLHLGSVPVWGEIILRHLHRTSLTMTEIMAGMGGDRDCWIAQHPLLGPWCIRGRACVFSQSHRMVDRWMPFLSRLIRL